MDQPSLFEAPRAPETKPAARPTKVPQLWKQMLERFKSHKYQSFSMAAIVKAYPERKPEVVQRAIFRLLKNGDIKYMPMEQGKPPRYTASIYKAGGLKR
jgi:hypothetical protein